MVPGAARADSYCSTCLGPAFSNLCPVVSRAPMPLMSIKSAGPTALGIAMKI